MCMLGEMLYMCEKRGTERETEKETDRQTMRKKDKNVCV